MGDKIKEKKQFDQDRFEITIENVIEDSQYRTKVVLAGNTDPGDIINGLIFDSQMTLRLLESIKRKYKL